MTWKSFDQKLQTSPSYKYFSCKKLQLLFHFPSTAWHCGLNKQISPSDLIESLFNFSSPFVSSDADGCRQWFSHCLHKLFKLPIRDQTQLLVVVLEKLIFFHNISIASSPGLETRIIELERLGCNITTYYISKITVFKNGGECNSKISAYDEKCWTTVVVHIL